MGLLQTMRPKQWVKNLIVFACIVFSMRMFEIELLFRNFLAFVLFCVLSGTVYIINDCADLENDRLHPVKSKRPIASGVVTPAFAIRSAAVLTVIGLGGSFLLGLNFGIVALAY